MSSPQATGNASTGSLWHYNSPNFHSPVCLGNRRKRILARQEEVRRNEAQLTLGFDKMELQQLDEERKDWDKRLTAIGREVDEEPAQILRSYQVQAHRVEPIGVVYLWPISG